MKRMSLVLIASALFITACGQQDNERASNARDGSTTGAVEAPREAPPAPQADAESKLEAAADAAGSAARDVMTSAESAVEKAAEKVETVASEAMETAESVAQAAAEKLETAKESLAAAVDKPARPEIMIASTSASQDEVMALAQSSGCLACHKLDTKLVGPSWQDVGKKYKGDPGARAMLIDKVKKGGSGNWNDITGGVPMPPYSPRVSDANIEKMVDFVLNP